MSPVVKNLLILNVIMFIITLFGEAQGIPMTYLLGGYVFGSPFFEPFQMVTHFFMHGGFFHIFFNMFALVMFGSILEQVWGPKRFFIFYFATAIGAFFIHQFVGYLELKQLESNLISQGVDLYNLNNDILVSNFTSLNSNYPSAIKGYYDAVRTPVVGASGAIYGLLVAYAYLFPNTRLMLLFPPIPVKAKWLVLFLVGISLMNSFQNNPGDNVAHLAHLGGALVGFIIVLIWQKNKRNFY